MKETMLEIRQTVKKLGKAVLVGEADTAYQMAEELERLAYEMKDKANVAVRKILTKKGSP